MLFALVRAILPTAVDARPLRAATLRRILVLPNYKVGDLVVAMPAIAYLRAAAPDAQLDVLVSDRNAALLDGDARVDHVLIHNAPQDSWLRTIRRLRRERYDLVVNFVLPHHAIQGIITALIAGRDGARLTTYRPAGFWGFFTHLPRVPGFERRYMADRLLHAARAALGDAGLAAGIGAYPPALFVAPEAAARVDRFLRERVPGPFVALNAWASHLLRTLSVEQGAALATAIAARHPELTVVLTPPPGADAAATAIATAAQLASGGTSGGRVVVFPSSPRLPDLVALLSRAALVVTPDTANIHLAAAVGRPVVALFTTLATERIAHWVPTFVPHRAVVGEGARPLTELPMTRAIEAFESLWAELAGGAAEVAPPLTDARP